MISHQSIQNVKIIEQSLYIYENVPDHIQIKENEYGYGLYTNKKIKKGEIFLSQGFVIYRENSIDKIFLITNTREYELDKYVHGDYSDVKAKTMWIGTYTVFLNHSCDPNITYETVNEVFNTNYIAIRDIEEGEQLTMNYNSFIYEWDIPIYCQCHSLKCLKEIKGYKYLDEPNRSKIHEILTKFDLELMIGQVDTSDK